MDKAFVGTIPDGRRFFAVERGGRRMPLLDGSGAVAFWPNPLTREARAAGVTEEFSRVLKVMDRPEGLKNVGP